MIMVIVNASNIDQSYEKSGDKIEYSVCYESEIQVIIYEIRL